VAVKSRFGFSLRKHVFSFCGKMTSTWAEDRATRARDPSADPGAKTEWANGRHDAALCLLCLWSFGIGTKR
jgi:hypothetical protein